MVLQLTMQLLEIFTFQVWCAAANSLQSCLTLCNPIDGSPPASPVPGVLQARTLEWVPFPSPTRESKDTQLCPNLRNHIDGSPSGSPVPGVLQARTLEWVAISFSNAWKWKVKVKSLSRVWLLVTPWTAAYQAPLSMGFSRQEWGSGVPEQINIVFLVVSSFFCCCCSRERNAIHWQSHWTQNINFPNSCPCPWQWASPHF